MDVQYKVRFEPYALPCERLVVPEPLWNAIMNTPGWFPVVETQR
ncbi:hypothetical protein [Paenibacillus sp.]|nr:hypothetical protein [Paenibacillus sp.]HZG57181.1 hypothetical protein [Paenibacillus sp.]